MLSFGEGLIDPFGPSPRWFRWRLADGKLSSLSRAEFDALMAWGEAERRANSARRTAPATPRPSMTQLERAIFRALERGDAADEEMRERAQDYLTRCGVASFADWATAVSYALHVTL